MSSDGQNGINELFADALEQPPEKRRVFVEAAVEDPEVRKQVLRMLDEDEHLGGFMGVLPVFEMEPREEERAPRSFSDGETVAGRYRIERLIKAGGMGEVYEAFDSKLNQRIALKTILPDIAGQGSFHDRFRREVTLARTVTNANVCRVFDFGEHTGGVGAPEVCFLTMEYLSGETLRERLKRSGRWRARQAFPVIRQMAQALSAAHAVGVAHRDFKPGNVLLVPQSDGTERVVVSDFGLARTVRKTDRSGQTLTASGQVLGTPEYMSPEQWAGRSAGAETDIYSLGLVVREMTTLEDLGPASREAWESVVNRCLAHNPADRPSSAIAVVDALEKTLLARPANQRSRRLLWMSAWAAVFFVSLVIAVSRSLVRKEVPRHPAAVDRIVVLPPRVDDSTLTLFADGLIDAITSRLTQYGGADGTLGVLPASEVRRGQVDAPSIARDKFGARYAVETALQSQGDRLRLTMAVIDTQNMTPKESAFVDGARSNAMAFQDSAVERLAGMLNAGVQPKYASELNRMNSLNPGAYEFYLQAKGYLKRNDRPGDIDAAIGVAQKALDRDPKYASAHTALAEAYWEKYGKTKDVEWVNRALRECTLALKLEPELAAAHTMMGNIYAGTAERDRAVIEFQKALQIDPRSFDAHLGLGRVYVALRDFGKAEAPLRRALELQRQDWRGYRELGLLYYHKSDYRKAAEQFEHVIDLTPDNLSAYSNLGAFYGILNEPKKSEEMLRKALAIDPNAIGALTNLAKLLADQGRKEEAATFWERAASVETRNFRIWGNLGSVYRDLKRDADAKRGFEQALQVLSAELAVDPANENLISNRAHFLASLGRKKEALADLARTGSMQGSETGMLVRDAMTLVELGEPGRARGLIQRALDLGYSRDQLLRNEGLRRALEGK